MVNLKIVASAILATGLLTACQGQNPFKRESNPVKNYPHTMESGNQPYTPGQKAKKPGSSANNDGAQVTPVVPPCFEPISASAEPDHGNLLLKFVEEVEGSYDINVTLNGTQKNPLETQKPADSEFILIARADNVYTYRLIWKPAKGSSTAATEAITIGFEGAVPQGSCPQSKNRVSFNVVVSKTNETPSVSFSDMKEKIKFGDKFDFKVIVDDPTALQNRTPVIKVRFSEARGSAVLNASAAVTTCDESKVLAPTKFEFVCKFDSNLIKGVEKLLSTGKEALASFQVVATSTKSGVNSAPTPQKIKVLFEKIETPKSVPPQGAKK